MANQLATLQYFVYFCGLETSIHKSMYNYLQHFLLISISLLLIFPGCKEKEEPIETINNRTILVYMLADNNLGNSYDYDNSNIEAMCRSFEGKNIDGHLVVFHADGTDHPTLHEISKSSPTGPCELKLLKTYTNAISTDSATIRQVVNDVKQLTPSSHYGLVLWSHATGWLPQNRFYAPGRSAAPTSLGREGDEERSVDIDVLTRALSTCHFDFILFDACLMGNVEIAYEMRNICDYIIATPTETVGEGFPYEHIASKMFEKEINYTYICEKYFEEILSPSNYIGGTITLINTQKIEQLAQVCATIVADKEEQIKAIDTKAIQHYDRSSTHIFFDLKHYMRALCSDEEYGQLHDALSQVVEYKAATSKFINIPIYHYSGLSCYIPFSSNDSITEEYYSRLEWYKRLYNTY